MKRLEKHYDVIIIGGGATGAGTARDCALRGLSVLLVERYDFTAGATGRNHGLLHSGARYAVNDHESAVECIKENRILRSIARHCIEDTGGLFISLPDDDPAYRDTFTEACRRAGIEAEPLTPAQAMKIEPSVNPSLTGAVKVPDGAVDPFRLTTANIIDARRHGADIMTYHEVTGFLREGNRLTGVIMRDVRTGTETEAEGSVIINAGGIWSHLIAQKAGIVINMFPAKGSLLIFGHRVNNVVINRCRKPSNADILVPGDTICLIGTTSDRIPFDQIDNMEVTPAEVDLLLREACRLSPQLATTRILRAYAGVRPLVASDDDPTGRSISRGIVCLDHARRDGLEGFITITGGKLMTYRLMAEWATDMACAKLGLDPADYRCTTAVTPLPGSENPARDTESDRPHRAHTIELSTEQRAAEGRHGTMAAEIEKSPVDDALVCECEQVSVGEVEFAINRLSVDNLINLRRRTRLGMGTCQGQLCACRAAGLLDKSNHCAEKSIADLCHFINERWKGMYPVVWGDTLSEIQFTSWIYCSVAGLDEFVRRHDIDPLLH